MGTPIHYGTKWSLVLNDPRIELGLNKLARYLGMTTTRHLQLAFFKWVKKENCWWDTLDCEESCLCSCDPHINPVRQEMEHLPLRIPVTEVASQVLGFIGENLFCFHRSISMQHEHIITTSWSKSNSSNSLGVQVQLSDNRDRHGDDYCLSKLNNRNCGFTTSTNIHSSHFLIFHPPPSLGNTVTL